MKQKKQKKSNTQPKDSKSPTIAPKEHAKYLPKISYAYSVVLTLVTLYSWFPTFTVDPQTMYFDGDHDTLQFIVKNNSFVPANLIKTTIDLNKLKINGSNFSNNKQITNDGSLIYTNKPRSIPFRIFQINLQPIKEIKESGLNFVITYSLPFIPITFTESHSFYAIKDSQISIKWLHI